MTKYRMPLRDSGTFFNLIDKDTRCWESPLSSEDFYFLRQLPEEFIEMERPSIQIDMRRDRDGTFVPKRIVRVA